MRTVLVGGTGVPAADGLCGFPPWGPYIAFVAGVFGLQFRLMSTAGGKLAYPLPERKKQHEYAVITLNYDRVLERCAQQLSSDGVTVAFRRADEDTYRFDGSLAKLHGCVTGPIVAPTWNKNLLGQEIKREWNLAFSLLSEANHLRLIGYSLPEADAYLRYLMKSAVLKNEHFKSIYVHCYDEGGDVSRRYNQFIRLKARLRFVNGRTEAYLSELTPVLDLGNGIYQYHPIERHQASENF